MEDNDPKAVLYGFSLGPGGLKCIEDISGQSLLSDLFKGVSLYDLVENPQRSIFVEGRDDYVLLDMKTSLYDFGVYVVKGSDVQDRLQSIYDSISGKGFSLMSYESGMAEIRYCHPEIRPNLERLYSRTISGRSSLCEDDIDFFF